MDNTHIVVIGNPVEGFEFIGPFATSDEAIAYGTDKLLKHDYGDADWWIASLNPKVSHEQT